MKREWFCTQPDVWTALSYTQVSRIAAVHRVDENVRAALRLAFMAHHARPAFKHCNTDWAVKPGSRGCVVLDSASSRKRLQGPACRLPDYFVHGAEGGQSGRGMSALT